MADEWSNKHGVESHAHFSEFVFFPGYWSLRILATLIAFKLPSHTFFSILIYFS